jgi:hypothetical protein
MELVESRDGKVMYCPGPDNEGGCGFHYEIATGRRFHYEWKRHQWFWATLAVISLFNFVRCQKKVYDR